MSTYRLTSAIWLGLLAVFLGLVPYYVVWLYGVGLAVTVSVLVTFTGGGWAVRANLPKLMAARRPAQLAYLGSIALVSVAGITTIIAS